MSCLYVLEVKPLCVALFASIFSHSIDCVFILLVVSLAVQKSVSLGPICLFLFLLLTDLRKHRYDLCQRLFCLFFLQGV